MRHTCAALVAILLFAASGRAQRSAPDDAFIAFRADATHVVATFEVIDVSLAKLPSASAPAPIARFGYPHFDLPASWEPQRRVNVRAGDAWRVHVGAGRIVPAVVDRVVGGQVGCQGAVGALLTIAPEDAATFAQRREHYYVAEPSPQPLTTSSTETQRLGPVGPVPTPTTQSFTRALESTMNTTFASAFARVRGETAAEIDRSLQSEVDYRRTWARERLDIDDALGRGGGRLRYDVQSFQLAPDATPVHFVRAEWLVGRRPGFAATFWLRGLSPLSVVDANMQPAVWLRMPEFEGEIRREHLGLVLNVTDRDRDGWAEVLFAHAGYEALHLSLLEYGPNGFQSTGIGYSAGC